MKFYQSMKVKFACDFNFESFPFDSHECDLDFGSPSNSYNYTLKFSPVKVLQQNNKAVLLKLDEEMKLPDGHLPYSFSILGKKEFPITNYEWDYPAIGIRIILKRKTLGTLIGGFYIPTALFAILSMISFFINPDVVSL